MIFVPIRIMQNFQEFLDEFDRVHRVPTPWYWTDESFKTYMRAKLSEVIHSLCPKLFFNSVDLDRNVIAHAIRAFYYYKFPLDEEGRYMGEDDFQRMIAVFEEDESDFLKLVNESRKGINYFEEYKFVEDFNSDAAMQKWLLKKIREMAVFAGDKKFDLFKNTFSMFSIEQVPDVPKFSKIQTIEYDEFLKYYKDALNARTAESDEDLKIEEVSSNRKKYTDEIFELINLNGTDPLRDAAISLGKMGAWLHMVSGLLRLRFGNVQYTFRGPVITIEDIYLSFEKIKRFVYGIITDGKPYDESFMFEKFTFYDMDRFDAIDVFIAWVLYTPPE